MNSRKNLSAFTWHFFFHPGWNWIHGAEQFWIFKRNIQCFTGAYQSNPGSPAAYYKVFLETGKRAIHKIRPDQWWIYNSSVQLSVSLIKSAITLSGCCHHFFLLWYHPDLPAKQRWLFPIQAAGFHCPGKPSRYWQISVEDRNRPLCWSRGTRRYHGCCADL